MSSQAISMEQVTKRYGEKTAVDGLTLNIKKGACFGFLGPNGAGKSTTVNLLSGLVRPTSGNIYINGLLVDGRDTRIQACLGIVHEHFLLFDRLTMAEHFLMFGPMYGLSVSEINHRMEELLDFLDLNGDRHIQACEASYGMKKKLCLALSLLHNPSILILDEPFEGLDPLATEKVRYVLLYLREKGKTIFLCSHILSLVEEIVEEVGLLFQGRLVFHDTAGGMKDKGLSLKEVFIQKTSSREKLKVERLQWLI